MIDPEAVSLVGTQFVRAASEHSGFDFKKRHQQPVRAGLVERPSNYPHLGSQRYTVSELLEICEYDKGRG